MLIKKKVFLSFQISAYVSYIFLFFPRKKTKKENSNLKRKVHRGALGTVNQLPLSCPPFALPVLSSPVQSIEAATPRLCRKLQAWETIDQNNEVSSGLRELIHHCGAWSTFCPQILGLRHCEPSSFTHVHKFPTDSLPLETLNKRS